MYLWLQTVQSVIDNFIFCIATTCFINYGLIFVIFCSYIYMNFPLCSKYFFSMLDSGLRCGLYGSAVKR